jgi:hypothetical protein
VRGHRVALRIEKENKLKVSTKESFTLRVKKVRTLTLKAENIGATHLQIMVNLVLAIAGNAELFALSLQVAENEGTHRKNLSNANRVVKAMVDDDFANRVNGIDKDGNEVEDRFTSLKEAWLASEEIVGKDARGASDKKKKSDPMQTAWEKKSVAQQNAWLKKNGLRRI